MNEHQIEAVANADAHTNNVGLATYSELRAALKNLTRPSFWANASDYEREQLKAVADMLAKGD